MSKPLDVINPYDNSVVASVSEADEQDVRAAIARATHAAPTMASMTAQKRAEILTKAAAIIEREASSIAKTMAQESGKPIKYARGEVSRAVETFTFAADAARSLHGETIPMDAAKGGAGKIGYYIRVPVGVIAAITPFNFPLNLVAHKVAPAVAAGCPIVLKPNPATPLTALHLADILREAGLPEGAFEVVVGGGDVGNWLVTDPRIAMISFTGSVPVAREISKVAGLRRTTFELGGNAATVIDESATLDQAVKATVTGGFAYSGQVCISVQRIYVHSSRYAEFRDKYVAAAQKLVIGDPLDEATDLGPMLNDGVCQRIDAWVAEAVAGGASVIAGGRREGRLYEATVIENATPDMKVVHEEVFGPVVVLAPFDDFEQALDAVNDSPFGLQAGVYTHDLNRALRATQRLNVGGIMINDVPTFRVDQMPYGGIKDSGVGREGPRFAIEDMTTLKMVVISMGV
ncbi:MAG: aldehyde dehydrogenase family protein [Chloroflexota bacterium]